MGIYLFLLAFCMGGGAWCVLAWAVKDGQFKDNDNAENMALASEDKYI